MQAKKSMAQYWWGQHHQVLFCKTSDGLLLHVPQVHLLQAIQEKKSVVLKKWLAIQAGEKRKKMEKGKEKDLEPSPPKEGDVVILPTPKRRKITPKEKSLGLPELPLEIIFMILLQSSEPVPTIRKIIFDVVKPGAETSMFSRGLASPKLIWRWYKEVLDREPPTHLAQLWNYYVKEMGDPNAFVRKWYSGFVREYDVTRIKDIYKASGSNKLNDVMRGVNIRLIIGMLRGRTIGMAQRDSSGVKDYQSVELIIAQVRTQRNSLTKNAKFPQMIFRWSQMIERAVIHAMLTYAERNFSQVSVVAYEDRQTVVHEEEWLLSTTNTWMTRVMDPILSSSRKVIRIIRGLGPDDVFSDKDYASLVWLIGVTLELVKKKSLDKTLDGRWSTVHYRESFLDKLQKDIFETISFQRGLTHQYVEDKRIRVLKLGYNESLWVLAGGTRKLTRSERKKKEKYEKETPELLSASIDLVPGFHEIPLSMYNSVMAYITNLLGYEDDKIEEVPPFSEILKALIRDGLRKGYSESRIKKQISRIIKRYMKEAWDVDTLDKDDFAKVKKDILAKIDLVLSKKKEPEEEEEEEAEPSWKKEEREAQRKRDVRDREYYRLRLQDAQKRKQGMGSSSSTTITSKIGGSPMRAIVTVDGSFVAAKIIGNRQNALFRLAKIHVQKNGLKWHITKPRSWTFNPNNPMGPHISLRKSMAKFVGQTLEVKILNISHFVDPPSRWVVMNVKLPEKFKCLYECHLSIGQERISTSQFWN